MTEDVDAVVARARFDAAGLLSEVDSRTESLNRKVREAQLNQVPLTLTIGPKEKENGTLAVRTLDGKVTYGVVRERFIDRVAENIRQRALTFDGF
jgi:threonyl-tRNA synthetase